MKAAIHKACGQVAFYLDDSVTVHSGIGSKDAYDLEGNHPPYGSKMTCYSCGNPTGKLNITIDWEDTSYAIQQGRDEKEKPHKARLASVPSAEEGL